MKILHTSDWHIGRTAGGHLDRTDDFRAVLAEVVAIARETKPDFVLHTGDLFDVARPAVADMMTGIQALQALATVAPVIVLAGNHDSPALFRLFNLVGNGLSAGQDRAAAGRIRFIDRMRTPEAGGIVDLYTESKQQRLRLAPLPFVHANRFLEEYRSPDTASRDYADHLRRAQEDLHRGLQDGFRIHDDVLVFAAHLYVEGALLSKSEKPMDVADTYLSHAAAIPPVAYAALGHIHRPQAVTRPGFPCRYAGSLLQLDFGESGEQKSVVLVEVEPGRAAHPQVIPLAAGRQLRVVQGTVADIAALAPEVGSDIVRVFVDTDTPTPHLGDMVRGLMPQAGIVSVDERCSAVKVKVLDGSTSDAAEEPGLTDLFREYLETTGVPNARADDVLATFATLLQEAATVESIEDGCAPLPEEDLLAAILAGTEPDASLRQQLLITRTREAELAADAEPADAAPPDIEQDDARVTEDAL